MARKDNFPESSDVPVPDWRQAEEIEMTDRREASEVLVAGAGPTGLMLACELALAGVRTVVLERLRERPGFCPGFNLNARSLELLDRRGIVERFIADGWRVPVTGLAGLDTPLSLAELQCGSPGCVQSRMETCRPSPRFIPVARSF
jgi:FAD binding domain